MTNRERVLALHAEGIARVEIARRVGVTPEWVRQVTSKRTAEELEALREQVRLRAVELRKQGVWPWATSG